jgi:hypothetical protein
LLIRRHDAITHGTTQFCLGRVRKLRPQHLSDERLGILAKGGKLFSCVVIEVVATKSGRVRLAVIPDFKATTLTAFIKQYWRRARQSTPMV